MPWVRRRLIIPAIRPMMTRGGTVKPCIRVGRGSGEQRNSEPTQGRLRVLGLVVNITASALRCRAGPNRQVLGNAGGTSAIPNRRSARSSKSRERRNGNWSALSLVNGREPSLGSMPFEALRAPFAFTTKASCCSPSGGRSHIPAGAWRCCQGEVRGIGAGAVAGFERHARRFDRPLHRRRVIGVWRHHVFTAAIAQP